MKMTKTKITLNQKIKPIFSDIKNLINIAIKDLKYDKKANFQEQTRKKQRKQ